MSVFLVSFTPKNIPITSQKHPKNICNRDIFRYPKTFVFGMFLVYPKQGSNRDIPITIPITNVFGMFSGPKKSQIGSSVTLRWSWRYVLPCFGGNWLVVWAVQQEAKEVCSEEVQEVSEFKSRFLRHWKIGSFLIPASFKDSSVGTSCRSQVFLGTTVPIILPSWFPWSKLE